ncbi:MAG: BamA/TamA family outer membrane protein, partial [Planctomycetota bacterium]|nr:BamA/TamA family outer membrane protein [Planctomycetota bacterium]
RRSTSHAVIPAQNAPAQSTRRTTSESRFIPNWGASRPVAPAMQPLRPFPNNVRLQSPNPAYPAPGYPTSNTGVQHADYRTNPYTGGQRGTSGGASGQYYDPNVRPVDYAVSPGQPYAAPPANPIYQPGGLPPSNSPSGVSYPPPGGNPQTSGYQPGPPDGQIFGAPPMPAYPEGIPPGSYPGVAPQDGGPPYQVFPESNYVDLSDQNLADLDAVVTETQTGRLMFGVGVNSNAGLIGNIVIDEQNFDIRRWPSSWEDFRSGNAFRGAGQRFRIEAAPGTEVSRYAISFQEPYLAGSQIGMGVAASYYQRFFQSWREERTTGRLSFGYQIPFRPDLSLTSSLRAEQVNISEPQIPTPPELAEVVGSNDLYGVKVGMMWDKRDNPFLPTEGHFVTTDVEQVFGTWQYPRFTAEARKYFTLRQRPDGSGRHVLAMGGEFGITADDTPIYDNFFAGGYSSLRGFAFRGASPVNMGVIIGGQMMALGSVEYIYPITADDTVRGSFFCDFGTVEQNVELTNDNIRVAPGFGFYVTIPAMGPAPIAFTFGFPVLQADTDNDQMFAFYIGMSR